MLILRQVEHLARLQVRLQPHFTSSAVSQKTPIQVVSANILRPFVTLSSTPSSLPKNRFSKLRGSGRRLFGSTSTLEVIKDSSDWVLLTRHPASSTWRFHHVLSLLSRLLFCLASPLTMNIAVLASDAYHGVFHHGSISGQAVLKPTRFRSVLLNSWRSACHSVRFA